MNKAADHSDHLNQLMNFHLIDEKTATSGQPTVEQFEVISNAGYEAIFNLAMNDSPGAIADENRITRQLNMEYVHIPVEFTSPALQDLHLFFMHMEKHNHKKKLIHCAMNWRVSVFMFLYHTIEKKLAIVDARHHLDAVWQPDPVWQDFIKQALQAHGTES